MKNLRTDLAIELREMFAEEIVGVESLRHDSDGITVAHVKIKDEKAALKIGKPVGNYVTVEISEMSYPDGEVCERAAKIVCDELRKLIPKNKMESVLVVGLGNRYITPDSIGPKTVSKLTVTRHISTETKNEFSFSLRPVSAIAPGVLGITGIETGEIVKGVVEHVKPSFVIAIDALAARKINRLGTTVQLCDTGISPGSGVGNNRQELTEKTLGVPVIAIGVPMVTDIASLVTDVIENMPNTSEVKRSANELKNNVGIVRDVLWGRNSNMVVTPNDVDIISEHASDIISEGINLALHS